MTASLITATVLFVVWGSIFGWMQAQLLDHRARLAEVEDELDHTHQLAHTVLFLLTAHLQGKDIETIRMPLRTDPEE